MVNLIKNYLPLRISLPSTLYPNVYEDTFLFVKQHIPTGHQQQSSSSKTLFIANVPFYPNVQTNILLKALFERFGNVEKVIVAPNPKKHIDNGFLENSTSDNGNNDDNEDMTLMFKREIRSLGGSKKQNEMTLDEYSWYNEGKFAHVVFSSPKTLARVLKEINGEKSKGIRFGKLEIQELEDISFALYCKEKKELELQSKDDEQNSNNSIDQYEEIESHQERKNGFANLVQSKRESIPSRATLKMLCNQIMAKYEEAEEAALKKQLAGKNQPDDDGFVTVSYGSHVGDIVDLEEDGTLGSTGGGLNKRNRSRSSRKNVVKGSDELKDFYRFQLKENKKRGMDELKSRFQEDLKRVKKMKEDKMFRPF